MSIPFSLVLLAVSMATLGGCSWGLICASGYVKRSLLETWVAWMLIAFLLVTGSGLILAWIGWLGKWELLGLHVVLFFVTAWCRRGKWRADRQAMLQLLNATFRILNGRDATARLAAVGVGGILILGALAAFARPVVYDALAYRLPRIAQWLQAARFEFLVLDDPRLNYMPVVPDLVMAWLLAWFDRGYLPAALAQWAGGVLLMLSTMGLAQRCGLKSPVAVGAGLLLLGMANVAPQFTSLHTDLFTAGIFTAAFFLWFAAWQRQEGSMIAGWGLGLAWGCKGTLFYFAPGVVIWVAWLLWRRSLGLREWMSTVLAGCLSVLIFAAPTYWLNWRHYGTPFGPGDYVAQHHAGAFQEKLGLNAWSALTQSFDPNAQPWGLQSFARTTGGYLAGTLPDDDRLVWEHMRRRTTLRAIMQRATPDADVTPFGLVPVVLFSLGVVFALRQRRRPGAELMLVWSAGILAFLLLFHGLQRWHPFGFRYFILAAPWMAVVTAWGLDQLARPMRLFLWGIAGWTVLSVGWIQNTSSLQAGWRAVVMPSRSSTYHVFASWRGWLRGLEPQNKRLTVALPANRPLAAFYRDEAASPIKLIKPPAEDIRTAEQFCRENGGGWIVVPATQFLGREGAVATDVWLDKGDEASPFSLAAYRLLRPGELAAPVFYRARREVEPGVIRWKLLVRAGGSDPVRFHLRNPGRVLAAYSMSTPRGRSTGALPAEREVECESSLAADAISEVIFEFHGPFQEVLPEVTLAGGRKP